MLFGLENSDLANNCFINVVIQNIWHLGGFKHVLKDTILAASNLNPEQDERVMCELANLLRNIKESQECSIHSVAALK